MAQQGYITTVHKTDKSLELIKKINHICSQRTIQPPWWIGSYQLRQTSSEAALWISESETLSFQNKIYFRGICLTWIKGRVYIGLETLLCHVSRTWTVNSCCRTWEEKNTYMVLQVRASITGTLKEGSDISSASASESLRFRHAASAQLFIFSPWTFLFCWTQSTSAYPPT
jgi:hypothetical protein